MQYSDMNRERKTNIKNGWQTDKAIVGGVKRAANAVSGVSKSIKRAISNAEEKVSSRLVNKVKKSKWWNS